MLHHRVLPVPLRQSGAEREGEELIASIEGTPKRFRLEKGEKRPQPEDGNGSGKRYEQRRKDWRRELRRQGET
jgi:hypothetical protein